MFFSVNTYGQIENPLTDPRNYKSLKVVDEKKRLTFKNMKIKVSRNYKQQLKSIQVESYNLVLPGNISMRNRNYKRPS
ncbi:hypothetical protein EGI22_23610 [Lacihabitans sp. LS3-19]|nr:hypothetical protein [Lacihabitans sp. LS3-19]